MRIVVYGIGLIVCILFVVAGLLAVFQNGIEAELWRGVFGIGFGAYLAHYLWGKIQVERSYYSEGY